MIGLTTNELENLVKRRLGADATLRARRPGRIYQLNVPAFMTDGDSAGIYIQPAKDGRLLVSDLAQTLMRISYTRDINEAVEERLAEVSEEHGFSVTDGAIHTTVAPDDLLGAVFGLVQIESCAERMLRPNASKGPRAEDFRDLVLQALREEFRELLTEHVKAPEDTHGVFTIDAVVNLSGVKIAVATVPSDLEAERAVGTKFASKSLNIPKWVAVPRDINKLTGKTRKRLMSEYLVPIPEFDDPREVVRLRQVA